MTPNGKTRKGNKLKLNILLQNTKRNLKNNVTKLITLQRKFFKSWLIPYFNVTEKVLNMIASVLFSDILIKKRKL